VDKESPLEECEVKGIFVYTVLLQMKREREREFKGRLWE
jgi:hypothetical protein